ncbi:hypothetical protein [Rhizobium giardinii]|uniref:hypothetical protein n=1 Tax=Rhizobium giardinii TaxID=56731 RepID=UPI003D6E5F09
MAAQGLTAGWTTDAIAFLSGNLPPSHDWDGWDHSFISAYQMGCEALAALGQADETERGAIRRKNPRLPDMLPRWDDICVTVLNLAEQNGSVTYLSPEVRATGSLPTTSTHFSDLRPNIVAVPGLEPANARTEVLSVLQTLGLVAEGSWTSLAETVLWRSKPRKWDFSSDARFTDAVVIASETVPDDVRAEMDRLAVITDVEVENFVRQSTEWYEKYRAQYGPSAKLSEPYTTEKARKSLEFKRRSDLDWLFFRRWRLPDGWLTPANPNRALEIFHDPLASAMRRAVAARLYPNVPFLAGRFS